MPCARHLVLTTAAGVGLILLTAAPASAHVEAEAEGTARAGSGPITVAFTGEAESTTAGVVGLKTKLPDGIAPADVSLASGPDGWALAPTDNGFQVSGPALAPGTNAAFRVTIPRLPADTTTLIFPTVQRYADGSEDAWIEPVLDGQPEPDKPAPSITVAAAANAAPQTSATESSPASSRPPADAATKPASEESSTGTVAVIGSIIAAIALLGGGLWWLRKRRA